MSEQAVLGGAETQRSRMTLIFPEATMVASPLPRLSACMAPDSIPARGLVSARAATVYARIMGGPVVGSTIAIWPSRLRCRSH